MSLILDGKKIDVHTDSGAKIPSASYLDKPRYALHAKGQRRRYTTWIRGIVLHTRMGVWPQKIEAHGVNKRWDEQLATRWDASGKAVGAHIAIDADGSFVCMCDCVTRAAYHAGQVNDVTIGIEIYQEPNGTIYRPSLETAVSIVDALTRELGIQRQFCVERDRSVRYASPRKRASGRKGDLAYMPGGHMGLDYVGVYGHRNCTRNRGLGDPGDVIWQLLAGAGYEAHNVSNQEDMDVWKRRQEALGFAREQCDGIPGHDTVAALTAAGHPHGLWIWRPSDDPPRSTLG